MGIVQNAKEEFVPEPVNKTVNVVNASGMNQTVLASSQYVPDPKMDWGDKEMATAEKRMAELFDQQNQIVETKATTVLDEEKITVDVKHYSDGQVSVDVKATGEKPGIVNVGSVSDVANLQGLSDTLKSFKDVTEKQEPYFREQFRTSVVGTPPLEVATLEQEYLALEARYRENKEILEKMDAIVLEMVRTKGTEYHWQDDTTKAVFQLKDRFSESNVAYTQAAMSRFYVAHTRRPQFNEKVGTLSLTDAKALGYSVGKE